MNRQRIKAHLQDWAPYWSVLLGGLVVMVPAVLAVFLTWKSLSGQLTELKIQNRPYLEVQFRDFGIVETKTKEVYAWMDIWVVNKGKVPASDLKFEWLIWDTDSVRTDPEGFYFGKAREFMIAPDGELPVPKPPAIKGISVSTFSTAVANNAKKNICAYSKLEGGVLKEPPEDKAFTIQVLLKYRGILKEQSYWYYGKYLALCRPAIPQKMFYLLPMNQKWDEGGKSPPEIKAPR